MTKNVQPDILAKRYAQAYFGVFGNELTLEDARHMKDASEFFKTHNQGMFLLKVPIISDETKQKTLEQICDQYNVPSAVHKLIALLIHDKRAFLIGRVLDWISKLYKLHARIYEFRFYASHALNQEAQKIAQGFLARMTGYDIIYSTRVDTKLIAGLRLESDNLLWEYSIAQQLRQLMLPMMY